MADPEIQQILGDPQMRSILQEMQTDPKKANAAMQDPQPRHHPQPRPNPYPNPYPNPNPNPNLNPEPNAHPNPDANPHPHPNPNPHLNPNPDQDPDISAKLQKLIAAGVLQVR